MESSAGADLCYDHSIGDLCIPECNEELKPCVGRTFNTLEDGELFYDTYARACGFQARKSTLTVKDGVPIIRYVLCNREGSNENSVSNISGKNTHNLRKRKTSSSRVHCMARIVLHYEAGNGYRVTTFNEGHTHSMVPETLRHLLKCNRKVESIHKIFIHAGIKANIGPVRSFRLYKELCGTYEDIGATRVDFMNYGRDLRAFVDGADAQIVIDNFKFKKENCEGFKYFSEVDEDGKLIRLFWADDISIKNYQIFGDAVSFDATYSTNRYKLIFTPFTGRDNHGRCITFVSCLIANEDVQSYKWVMEKFIECMTTSPVLLITDQDPALRKVVPEVFPNTRHRYCLWHITKKIPDKISTALRHDPNFKTELDGLIWSDLEEPYEFEERWHSIMDQFDLTTNKWFCEMFECRKFWISAYFRDISMSGLFKTTSLSESENSFFKRYLNKNSDLVRFHMHYDSAIDAQRSSYNVATLADETGVPKLETHHPLEHHASIVYTNTKFYEIQDEIVCAVMNCVATSIQSINSHKVYDIDDGSGSKFKALYDQAADLITCSCKAFIRMGIPCRHMIFVMRTMRLNKIPDRYILKRWSKLSRCSMYNADISSSLFNENLVVTTHQFFSEVGKSVQAVKNNVELQYQLLADLKVISAKYSKIGINPDSSTSKTTMIESFYGSKYPETIDVHAPDVVSTKGSGAGGRIKSTKEKAIKSNIKPPRNCRKCNRLVNHDSRNCPEKDK